MGDALHGNLMRWHHFDVVVQVWDPNPDVTEALAEGVITTFANGDDPVIQGKPWARAKYRFRAVDDIQTPPRPRP